MSPSLIFIPIRDRTRQLTPPSTAISSAGSVGRSLAETIYDGAINGAIGQAGGTLKSSTKVDAGGLVGREAVFYAPGQKESVRVRYFLVGDRLYQVAYDGPAGSESGKEASTFLESFKMVR